MKDIEPFEKLHDAMVNCFMEIAKATGFIRFMDWLAGKLAEKNGG